MKKMNMICDKLNCFRINILIKLDGIFFNIIKAMHKPTAIQHNKGMYNKPKLISY